MTKTNKALKKRVKITSKGAKIRGSGFGHFNAKMSRKKQLNKKRGRSLVFSSKERKQFLANIN